MTSNIRAIFVCCVLLLAASGCTQNETGQLTEASPQAAAPSTSPTATDVRANACALIMAGEIEKVQGEKIIETKPSSQRADNFAVAQCYYVATDNAKSVVLSVYRADPDNPTGQRPKQFWQERFAALGEENGNVSNGERKKEKSTPPQPVKGLGDEAYWLDNKLGGALYVLKGDEFLRVSVGGTTDTDLRISKAKSIAQEALKRM